MKPLYPLLINQGICALIDLDIKSIFTVNDLPLEPVTDYKGKKYYSDMLFKLAVILENIYPIEGLPLTAYTLIAQYANNIHYRTNDVNSLVFQKHFETNSKKLSKVLKNNHMVLEMKSIYQALMLAYQIKCAYFDDYCAIIKSFDYIYDKEDRNQAHLTIECA